MKCVTGLLLAYNMIIVIYGSRMTLFVLQIKETMHKESDKVYNDEDADEEVIVKTKMMMSPI